MLRHVRTTLDLPDPLFQKAKRLARERGIPFRAVVAEGLQLLLKEQKSKEVFHLVDASFHGDGLATGLSETDWERIRDLAYEGRG
jgi:hypothetical protein